MNENDSASSPSVSVIVPVYKVEKYLRDCVESVLAQSFTDFELILVDDGSPDKCGEICDELAKKDPRIRVFHQANGGVTSARRLGVEQARGEWINFVDSDDLLPKDALKILIDEASDDTDWVQGWKVDFNDGEAPSVESRAGEVKSFDLVGLVENMIIHHAPLWGKIVRRTLFTPHAMAVPREMKMGEDVLMNLRLIVNKLQKAKEIDEVVYLYRVRENSIIRSCVVTEGYVFRYAKLMFAEARSISTPRTKKRLFRVLSQRLCGVISWQLIRYGMPIKFPHRLAMLMHRGIGSNQKFLFVYFCLKFNCPWVYYFLAKTYRFLRGRKLNMEGKTLLE